MNPILNSIDFIARSPGGVALMRKLVLELAVRGKLVPQDPKDEPASVLLERIKREKARLVKEGKIKAGKELPEIKEEEKPYELPRGWAWARLGNLSPYGVFDGDWIESKDQDKNGKIKLIQLADIQENLYHEKSNRYVNEETFYRLQCSEVVQNDILIARLPNPIGRACVFPGSKNKCITAVDIAILRSCSHIDNKLISLFINSPTAKDQIIDFGKGATRFRVSTGDLKTVLLPLPPLAEQSRIVACVQELMDVLDRLEDQTNKTEEERNRALTAATQAISQAATSEEIASSWLRLATHIDRLVDRAEDVKTIRAMVLELAVRGKLVPQDPKDEPASVLLERIQREKARLVKEGKIKAGKELPEITEEERPFKLPSGWKWERLGKIVKKLTDGTHHSPINKPTGAFLYISAKNIKWTGLDLSEITYVTEEVHKEIYSRCDPEFGDILYIKDGATTGISAINTIHKPFSMLSSVALLKPSCGVLKEYLHTVLQSPYFFRLMRQGMSGVAITRITLEKLGMAPFPLAPLHEQSRILARVQELMAILDRLEEKLAAREKAAVLASESIAKMHQA